MKKIILLIVLGFLTFSLWAQSDIYDVVKDKYESYETYMLNGNLRLAKQELNDLIPAMYYMFSMLYDDAIDGSDGANQKLELDTLFNTTFTTPVFVYSETGSNNLNFSWGTNSGIAYESNDSLIISEYFTIGSDGILTADTTVDFTTKILVDTIYFPDNSFVVKALNNISLSFGTANGLLYNLNDTIGVLSKTTVDVAGIMTMDTTVDINDALYVDTIIFQNGDKLANLDDNVDLSFGTNTGLVYETNDTLNVSEKTTIGVDEIITMDTTLTLNDNMYVDTIIFQNGDKLSDLDDNVDLSFGSDGGILYELNDTIAVSDGVVFNGDGMVVNDTVHILDRVYYNNAGLPLYSTYNAGFFIGYYDGNLKFYWGATGGGFVNDQASGKQMIIDNSQIYLHHDLVDISTELKIRDTLINDLIEAHSIDTVGVHDFDSISSSEYQLNLGQGSDTVGLLAIWDDGCSCYVIDTASLSRADQFTRMYIDTISGLNGDSVEILGYLKTDSVVCLNNNYSDFVFDKNYTLISLKEQINYAYKNGHLEGMRRGERMNVTQYINDLEMKLEELYLYSYQQQKIIDLLIENNNRRSRIFKRRN
jgi:hypothetical protein